MKRLTKSINKYLADHVPMNKPKHEGLGRHNHPQPLPSNKITTPSIMILNKT